MEKNKLNTIYEFCWLVTTIFLVIYLPLLFGSAQIDWISYYLTMFASISGVISVLLVAKLNRWNMPFGLGETILWVVAFIFWGAFALAAVYIIAAIGIIFTFVSWTNSKNKNLDNLIIADKKPLPIKSWIQLFIFGLIVFILMFSLAFLNQDMEAIYFVVGDALSATVLLCALILMLKRRSEQWILWFFYNSILIVWGAIHFSNTNDPTSLISVILFSSYLLNSIYGFLVWQRSDRR